MRRKKRYSMGWWHLTTKTNFKQNKTFGMFRKNKKKEKKKVVQTKPHINIRRSKAKDVEKHWNN